MTGARRWSIDAPPFAGRTGRGVRVAVIDSGVQAAHPHITAVHGGARILPDGVDEDVGDDIGHGTAVAAAILDRAPGIELLAVRVFDRTLQTTAEILARGIEWSASHGAALINLSLGTPNPAHAERLGQAIRMAAARGAVVVSARDARAPVLLPGTLDGVIGVAADWECGRDTLTAARMPDERISLAASPLPRPIPGLPPERNLSGVSFAVANATGYLARLLEAQPELRHAGAILAGLAP